MKVRISPIAGHQRRECSLWLAVDFPRFLATLGFSHKAAGAMVEGAAMESTEYVPAPVRFV